MKRNLVFLFIIILSYSTFSSEVENFLKKAMESYNSGDISAAIADVDSAKKILELGTAIKPSVKEFSETAKVQETLFFTNFSSTSVVSDRIFSISGKIFILR